MASLADIPRGEVGDSKASIAQAPTTSPSDTGKNTLEANQGIQNESKGAPDTQDNHEHDLPSMSIEHVKAIIESKLIEPVIRLPEGYFERYIQIQRYSAFWNKLFSPPLDADITYRPPLKSREWAEYVVDASRIFFEAGLSVKKAVSIINHAILFAAVYLLNRGTEKIYFDDGRNVFYEYESWGMPAELKVKYKAFLKGMKSSIVEGVKAHSEPHLEGAVGQNVVDVPSVVVTPPMEPFIAPAEPGASMIETEERHDDQAQGINEPEPQKQRRNRARSKRKGKKNAARKAMLVPKDINSEDVKITNGKRWKNSRKKKEKMKKRLEAERQAKGV